MITARDVTDLIGGLQAAEYGVTTIDAQGATGPVKIVFTIVRRPAEDSAEAIDGITRLYLVGIAFQCLHFTEEFVTGFYVRAP